MRYFLCKQKMKLRFLFVNLILFFHLIVHAQLNEATDINLQGQIPRIEFETTNFNFGNIYRGSIVFHAFSFENTGNGVLVLNSLHASCGCLNTKIFAKDGKTSQSIFQPHEGGVIQVTFDTSQFSGYVVRTVTAETNMGSSSPTVTLKIMANINQELYSNPYLLYLGKIDKETKKIFSVNVVLLNRAESTQTKPFQVSSVESSLPFLEAQLSTKSDSKNQKIEVKIKSPPPIGPFQGKLIVKNNSEFNKNYEIPVVGEVLGRVDSSAKYVEFGVVNPQKSSERVIRYSSSVKNFSITSVKINLKRLPDMGDIHNSELFEIKKEKLNSRTNSDPDSQVGYELHFKLIYPKKLESISVQNKGSAINVSGNFLVKTNDPDYKEITVPFFGVLRMEQ